jgi:hypothetical protein
MLSAHEAREKCFMGAAELRQRDRIIAVLQLKD